MPPRFDYKKAKEFHDYFNDDVHVEGVGTVRWQEHIRFVKQPDGSLAELTKPIKI